MAVNTTVEVVMPPMGDSVSEGSILEWHKQEGDEVSEDETLVEISTDKVDAEVPAPVSGTVVKILAAEGDTVGVGSVLAEIAPGENGSGPALEVDEPAPAEATVIEIEMPAMGESVSEGTILEWAKEPGDHVEVDETIVEISTDKVDAEVPAPAAGTITELLADAGDTVSVGQVIARMTSGNGAKPAVAPAPEPTEVRPAGEPETTVTTPDGLKVTPVAARVAAAQGSTSRRSRAPAPMAASARPTCSPTARTAPPRPRLPVPTQPPSRPCSRARARCSRATWTSRARSRPRPRSARSPSPTSTRAASSSRRPATASRSRT